jgi:pheromone shutdown-related protein TraB
MDEVIEVNAAGKQIFLVGTAHVSRESVELVENTIRQTKPDAVAVELCKQRSEAILNEKKWEATEIEDVMKSGRTSLFLAQVLVANYQRRIGDRLGVKPGEEMVAALRAAKEVGARAEFVDRDIKVTLRRAAGRMTFREKAKILFDVVYGIIEGEEVDKELVERLKERDVLSEFIAELSADAPSIKEVLVDERDSYIAGKIAAVDAKKIVAVVGAGHVEGIRRLLESNAEKTDLKSLENIPQKKSALKYVGHAIPILFAAIIAWGFLKHGGGVSWEMISKWFLITGTLSALGAAAALAHPLSIATAFLAAPFTTLHPAIAAGWVSGFVELKVRKPRVVDFTNLMKLNSMRDYWGNRVVKVFLVISLTNVGASLGTFIAIPYIASLI